MGKNESERDAHTQKERWEKKQEREKDTDMWLDPSGPALFQPASENLCINQPSSKCATFQRVTNFIKEKWCYSLTLCTRRINRGPERSHSLCCTVNHLQAAWEIGGVFPSHCSSQDQTLHATMDTFVHAGKHTRLQRTHLCSQTSPFVQRQQRSAQSAQAHV